MKASLVTDFYLNNKIFDVHDAIKNRDNCLYKYHCLREQFKSNGVDLSTCDINEPSSSNYVVYCDVTQKIQRPDNAPTPFLILFESHVIKPCNWNLGRHSQFSTIFTWNDAFVDEKKYVKINFAHKFPDVFDIHYPKEKLCVLIAGNKMVKHPLELYSERIKAIRWFEENHSNDFDLYGIGWDQYCSPYRYIQGAVRKIPPLSRLMRTRYPSYVGRVVNKQEVMKKYKFSICYENVVDIPGYITEKIFDSFFAGCVPIYLGANNIDEHIPKNCFIDKRNYPSYEYLYEYISQMPDSEYYAYLENITKFLEGEVAQRFKAENFAKIVTDHVIGNEHMYV